MYTYTYICICISTGLHIDTHIYIYAYIQRFQDARTYSSVERYMCLNIQISYIVTSRALWASWRQTGDPPRRWLTGEPESRCACASSSGRVISRRPEVSDSSPWALQCLRLAGRAPRSVGANKLPGRSSGALTAAFSCLAPTTSLRAGSMCASPASGRAGRLPGGWRPGEAPARRSSLCARLVL